MYCYRSPMKSTLSWGEIVKDYSSRKLTFGRDKLPALAGLAQKVQTATKHTYVAGLWLETLAWDLLWTSRVVYWVHEKPKYSLNRLESIPSWSWASVDCRVEMPAPIKSYLDANVTHHAFILGIEGLPPGKDAFGQVPGATLNIECEVLVPILQTLGRQTEFSYPRVDDASSFNFWAEFDCEEPTMDRKICLLPLHTLIYKKAIFASAIHCGYDLSEPKGYRIVVGGLILEQTGRKIGEYRRLGTFNLKFLSQEQVQSWFKLTKVFIPELTETDYEKRYFDATTGNERCLIKII
jgi:hypothetical protein